MLEQEVLAYIDRLESTSYWHEILENYGSADIENTIVDLLHRGDTRVFSEACLFLRDLTLFVPRLSETSSLLPLSKPITQAIESGLNSPALLTRKTAVHTLGKICAARSLPVLRTAFEESVGKDPLLLTDLAFEIRWLSNQLDSPHSEIPWLSRTCLNATCYLSRWAGVQILDNVRCDSDSLDWQRKHDALIDFSQDEDHHVQANAMFFFEEMAFEKSLATVESRPEKRRLRRELERRRPTSFDAISAAFIHYLRNSDSESYTPTALDSFVAVSCLGLVKWRPGDPTETPHIK